MSSPGSICRKCGKQGQEGISGSLTQWVSLCKCDLFDSDELSGNTIQICLLCEKRIGSGRVGTFTQWIFRDDICSCADPKPVGRSIKALSEGAFKNAQIKISAIVEIDVDKDKFPQERFAPVDTISSTYNSTIYLAVDRLLGTRVAIKTVSLYQSEDIVRFQKEGKALASLFHPGLVRILDFAEKNGAPYMVMEYVEGVSLRNYLNLNKNLSLSDALAVVYKLSNILSYCHSKCIFHRDIKPENIMVSSSEESQLELKLVDFGLACTFNSVSKLTDAQAGTPLYMSPDTSKGEKYDARSEVYSVGCVLFELICGAPPYESESPLKLLELHAEAEIPTLSSRMPESEFDAQLESLVARCLAKSPSDRYQSMEELKVEIEDLSKNLTGKHSLVEIADSGQSVYNLSEKPLTSGTDGGARKPVAGGPIVLYVVFSLLGLSTLGYVVSTLMNNENNVSPQAIKTDMKLDVPTDHLKIDMTSSLEINPEMSQAVVIGAASHSTRVLNFIGSELKDRQLVILAKSSPFVREFGLNNCDGVSPEGLAKYFYKVKPAEIILANSSCNPEFIRALAYNKMVKVLRLQDADPDDIAAIPESLTDLRTLDLLKSNINEKHLEALSKLKQLTKLQFSDCVFEPGVEKKLKKSLPGVAINLSR